MTSDIKIRVSEKINFDFESWRILQAKAKTENEIQEAGKYLVEIMKQAISEEKVIKEEMKKVNRSYKKTNGFYKYEKPEEAEQVGYLSFIYKTTPSNPNQIFFFYDFIVKTEIVEFLVESEMIEYYGKKMHQGEKHKSWSIPKEDNNDRIQLKTEMKKLLNNSKKKKDILKSAIELRLNFGGDYSLNQLMNNTKFKLLTEGFEDLILMEKEIVFENVNQSFLGSIKELESEEIIRINKYGRIFPAKNHKRKTFKKIEKEIGYPYIII